MSTRIELQERLACRQMASFLAECLVGMRPTACPNMDLSTATTSAARANIMRNPYKAAWLSLLHRIEGCGTTDELAKRSRDWLAALPHGADGSVLMTDQAFSALKSQLQLSLLGQEPCAILDMLIDHMSGWEVMPAHNVTSVARALQDALGDGFSWLRHPEKAKNGKAMIWVSRKHADTGKIAGRWIYIDGSDCARTGEAINRAATIIAKDIADTITPDMSKEAQKAARERAKGYERFANWVGKTETINSLLAHLAHKNTVETEKLDFNDFVLNTPGGMVDLRTGALMDADPREYLTRQTAVVPDMENEPKRFLAFVREICSDRQDIVDYVLDELSYGLSGVKSRRMMFLRGSGQNGKSTLLEIIARILGNQYATVTENALFSTATGDRSEKKYALGNLRNVRYAYQSELPADANLDLPILKQITGDMSFSGRGMRENAQVTKAQATLVVSINPLPTMLDAGKAEGDRFKLVNLLFRATAPDPTLPAQLWAEAPQILGHMIKRFARIQQAGGNPPAIPLAVQQASEAWLDDANPTLAALKTYIRKGGENDYVLLHDVKQTLMQIASRDVAGDRYAQRASASKNKIESILAQEFDGVPVSSVNGVRKRYTSVIQAKKVMTPIVTHVRWIGRDDLPTSADTFLDPASGQAHDAMQSLQELWDAARERLSAEELRNKSFASQFGS